MKKRFWSKKPLVHAAIRLSEPERELWRAAAMKAGLSLNDLVRNAIKEKSATLLSAETSTQTT